MRKYILTIMTLCLSGIFLVLLAFLLTPNVSSAPPAQDVGVLEVPDLVIDVQAEDETVLVYEVISYTLLYTNTLNQSLSNVIISSTVSAQQYYSGSYHSDPPVSVSNFSVTGTFEAGYILEWQLGSLAPQTGGWIVITSTLPPAPWPTV